MRLVKRGAFIIVFIVLFIMSFQFQACKNDPIGIEKLDTIYFDSNIASIFSGGCNLQGCHSAESRKAGLDVTSYASVMKNVAKGNAWKSKIYNVVSEPNNPNFMPPSGHQALEINEITKIEVWIQQGAKEKKFQ